MTQHLTDARERVVDQILAGDVRSLNAPIMAIREPEPSFHPDARMHWSLRDIKATIPAPAVKQSLPGSENLPAPRPIGPGGQNNAPAAG